MATGPVASIEAPGIKIDGDLLYNMRGEVARLLDRKNQSFPGAQPVSFSRKHLEELTRQEYVPFPHSFPLYPN
jgi:mRNA guanylyltransferase